MIKGIGVDLVELSRMRELIEKKPTFVKRILTKKEVALFDKLKDRRQVEFLGGRYACKEAFSKAKGTGIGALSFQDIEILNLESGQPVITSTKQHEKIWVSISHTDTMAIAQVVIEE